METRHWSERVSGWRNSKWRRQKAATLKHPCIRVRRLWAGSQLPSRGFATHRQSATPAPSTKLGVLEEQSKLVSESLTQFSRNRSSKKKKTLSIIWHIVLMYSPVIERSRTKLSMNIPVAFLNPCTATGVKYRSSRLAFVPFFRGLDAAYLLSLGEVRCPHAICGSPPLLCQLLLIQYLP